MYLDVVESRVRRAAGPSTAQERDFVADPREPSEDLVHVDLGATRLRILAVLPIDEQDPH
jgi:hypothetical protein